MEDQLSALRREALRREMKDQLYFWQWVFDKIQEEAHQLKKRMHPDAPESLMEYVKNLISVCEDANVKCDELMGEL